MDSRDSSTTSRDGDEDGLFSINAAKEATLLFDSGRFSECLEILHKLLEKKDDPKVLHNIIVAEYFRDGCSDPRKILEVLNSIKKRSEDLARASGEQGETLGNHVNNATTGFKGSGTGPYLHSASDTNIAYVDEYDTSVATLNIAVVMFHLHEYANAISILEPLYQNIEPIDERPALQICLLLLDVALASHDASRAADVLQYLEKGLGVGYMIGQGDNGSIAQPQFSHTPLKTSSTPNNPTSIDISTPDSAPNTSENPLERSLSDEHYENLLSTLDIGGQNLVRAPGLTSSNDLSKTSLDRSISALDLKLKLQLYRVRLLILTRNLKAAKREMKSAMNIFRGRGDSSTALLLKSQLEYARGNHRKAIKLLTTSSNRTEPVMHSMFNNDLGCIYHQLQKHHAATVLFANALKSSSRLRSERPLRLSAFTQDKSLLIVYNCGLQYLICGKPLVASRCFQKAGVVFYNRPLFWLRIAECCILALEKGFLELTRVPNNEEVRVHVAGKGKWRHLVVEGGESKIRKFDVTEQNDVLMGGDDHHKLSIPFGRQCLLNALHLLNSSELKSLKGGLSCGIEDDESSQRSLKDSNHKNLLEGDSKVFNMTGVFTQASANGDAKDPKGAVNPNTTLLSSVSVYEDIRRRENHLIKHTVLADLAYVELLLENPLKALSAANSLLRLPECSRIYSFLGHMYAAEALCRLNRSKEAAEHLSVYMSDGINADFPYSEEDSEKWRGEKAVINCEEVSNGFIAGKREALEEFQGIELPKPAEALGTLYANLAAMSGIQGDLEQAHRFASKALTIIPNKRQVILTAVYVDLLLGRSQEALVKLKECNRVRFLSSGVTLCKSS